MRVVHHDGELLALVDRLEPARDTRHGSHALDDRVLVDVEEERRSDGAEDVLDVEDPEQPRLEPDAGGGEPRSARIELELLRPHVRLRTQPERDERRALRALELLARAGGRTDRRRSRQPAVERCR